MDFQARWGKAVQSGFHPSLKRVKAPAKLSPLVDVEVTTECLGVDVDNEFRYEVESIITHELELIGKTPAQSLLEGHATLAARILLACNKDAQLAFSVYIKMQQLLRVYSSEPSLERLRSDLLFSAQWLSEECPVLTSNFNRLCSQPK